MLIAGSYLTVTVGGMNRQGFNLVSLLEPMSTVVAVGKAKHSSIRQ